MQNKCRLGFLVFMISNSLVQVAGAVENGALKNITDEGSVSKGSAMIGNPFNSNITIKGGGVEIVKN